jgi:V8-like Glu-specific endopeptidase
MWSRWLTSLNDALADLYPSEKDAVRLANAAGMKTALIDFSGASLVRWYNVLEYAAKSHGKKPGHPPKADAILDLALEEWGDHDILLALKHDEPPVVKGPDPDWVAPTDDEHHEKIIGAQSTLLPIRFLELGMQRARSVARVVRADRSSGTGFLIGNGWLLTNNHVLPSPETAQGAVAEMNYQQTLDGLDAQVERFALDPARFHTSKANDWTAIGIDAAADTWGAIELVDAETAVDRYVSIIQHPGGGPKQIGLYHNTVAYVGNGRIQYLTDTLPGSSGAPVFDDQWCVVALHHSGGMLREPGTKKSFYRNEGIAVTTVIADLRAAGVL